jgi:HSP20 family protein
MIFANMFLEQSKEVGMYSTVLDDLFNLSREMNRIFDRTGRPDRGRWPETNVYEDHDAYTVVAKVPGMEKSELELQMKDNALSIKGERKKENDGKGKVHLDERFAGAFERSFLFNEKIDDSAIKAEAKDGLLIIRLPKSPETKPKTIAIK